MVSVHGAELLMLVWLIVAAATSAVLALPLAPLPAAALFCVGGALSLFWMWCGRWAAAPLAATGIAGALAAIASPLAWHPWIAAALFLVTAVGAWMLWLAPIPRLPEGTGPHAIGMRIVELDLALDGASRRVQLYIWYPAREHGGKRRLFHTHAEARVFSSALHALGAPSFLNDQFRLTRTDAVENAAPLEGAWPLVVFSHGGGLAPTANTSLMLALASHGYVAVSLGRPGESAGIAWSDGARTPISAEAIQNLVGNQAPLEQHARFLLSADAAERRQILQGLSAHYADTLGATVRRWARESIVVANTFLAPPPALRDLAAICDCASRAYVGMSLGGATAAECCFADPLARAGINLDGMNWTPAPLDADCPTPFLHVANDPALTPPQLRALVPDATSSLAPPAFLYSDFFYERPERRGARAEIVRAFASGAAHMDFTDQTLTARGVWRKRSGLGPGGGRRFASDLNALCVAFLDAYLKNGDKAEIDHALKASATLRRHAPGGG